MYAKLKKFHDAKHCYLKMLKIALKIRDYSMELQAYDQIGIMYFSINVINKAHYFHRKTMEARIEPENSNLRLLVVNTAKIDKTDKNFIPGEFNSESEEEVSDLYFDPMWKDEERTDENDKVLKNLSGLPHIPGDFGSGIAKRDIGNVKVFGKGNAAKKIKVAHFY